MSKKGFYNGAFFNTFATRLHGTPIRFGLLVGLEADDCRDVVFAAPTPPLPRADGEQEEAAKDVPTLLKACGSMTFPEWFSQHAIAVRNLLPGGLDICGCFVVAGEAAAKDLANALVAVLKDFKDPLVLSVDPVSRKMSFWQHVGGAKPSLRPLALKADSYKESLLLWASVSLDILVPHDTSSTANSDVETLAGSVRRCVAESLSGCSVTLMADPDKSPKVVDVGRETALSSAVPKDCREVQAAFFRDSAIITVPGSSTARRRLRFRCLVVATTLVLRRHVELRHAIEMLRKDLASSAGTRLQLALEETESNTGGTRTALPWRPLRRPRDTDLPLWCGDYCLPDEAPGVELERLGQLLGLPESSFEKAPGHLDEWVQLESIHVGTYGPPPVPGSASTLPGKQKVHLPLSAVACGAAVAVMAAALAVPFLWK